MTGELINLRNSAVSYVKTVYDKIDIFKQYMIITFILKKEVLNCKLENNMDVDIKMHKKKNKKKRHK